MEVLYGLHPVEEAIRSGARQLDHVTVARERRDERLERLIELCRTSGVRVSLEPPRPTHPASPVPTPTRASSPSSASEKFLGIEDLSSPQPSPDTTGSS